MVDEDLFPVRMFEETDQDFDNRIRSHDRLDRLIFESTKSLPVSSISDEEKGVEPFETEEEFELAFEDEGEALEFEEESEIILSLGDPSLMNPSLDLDEDEAGQFLMGKAAEIEANRVEVQPVSVLNGDGPAPDVMESEIGNEEESELVAQGPNSSESEADGVSDQDDLLQLHIVDHSNHKHCAVAGQLSFF